MWKITIFKLRLINNSLKYRCFLKENTIKTRRFWYENKPNTRDD